MAFSQRILLLIAITNIGRIGAHDSPFNPLNLFKRTDIDWANHPEWYKKIDTPPGGWDNAVDWKGHPEWYSGGDKKAPPPPVSQPVDVHVEVKSESNQGSGGDDHHDGGDNNDHHSGGNNNGYGSNKGGTDDIGSDVCGNGGCKSQKEYCAAIKRNGKTDPKCDEGSQKTDEQTTEKTTTSTEHSGGEGNKECGTSSAQCPPGCLMTIKFTSSSIGVPFTTNGYGHSDSDKTSNSCICMTGKNGDNSVRVNIGSTNHLDHTSLVEGFSQGVDSDNSYWDVSYVEGFSYPVVCWNDKDPSRMSGSNIDLYDGGNTPCSSDPSKKKMGDICVNDGYQKLTVMDPEERKKNKCWECTLPSKFFAPASGAAYVYPQDDCPCASAPVDGKKYASPMTNGGAITCCVGGPDRCCANSMSHGGQTVKGNCNRGCRPCAEAPMGSCAGSCGVKKNKRDFERVLQQASLRKRRQHHHHHGH